MERLSHVVTKRNSREDINCPTLSFSSSLYLFHFGGFSKQKPAKTTTHVWLVLRHVAYCFWFSIIC